MMLCQLVLTFTTLVNCAQGFTSPMHGILFSRATVGRETNLYYKEPCLGDFMECTFDTSDHVYAFAAIRDAVRANESKEDSDPKKKKLNDPSLILTQQGDQRLKERDGIRIRYLKYDISIDAIKKFVDNNREFVQEIIIDNRFKRDPTKPGPIEEAIDGNKDDVVIKEFDDRFSHSQLVYAITVNKTKKRIIVTFRGSVVGADWEANLNAGLENLDTPPALANDKLSEKIQIHQGFYNYLNEEVNQSPLITKYDRIVDNLQYILTTEDLSEEDKRQGKLGPYHDYDVCIAGHSLGGALAQDLTFRLAGEEKLKGYRAADRPIIAITYESPKVGTDGFRDAFRKLEDKKLVQHVRVSNAGDGVVASVPIFGYTQTGINLHIQKGKDIDVKYGPSDHESVAEVLTYAVPRSWTNPVVLVCFFCTGFGWKLTLVNLVVLGFAFLRYHGLDDLQKKLSESENAGELMEKTITELYLSAEST